MEPPEELRETLRAAVLASDARLLRGEADGAWRVRGDPTEGALVVAAAKAGLRRAELEAEFPRVDEIPFTSESKRMTTLHETHDGVVAYAKGAPEVILGDCTRQLDASGETALDDADRGALLAAARQMASEALRVLAVARRSERHARDGRAGPNLSGPDRDDRSAASRSQARRSRSASGQASRR